MTCKLVSSDFVVIADRGMLQDCSAYFSVLFEGKFNDQGTIVSVPDWCSAHSLEYLIYALQIIRNGEEFMITKAELAWEVLHLADYFQLHEQILNQICKRVKISSTEALTWLIDGDLLANLGTAWVNLTKILQDTIIEDFDALLNHDDILKLPNLFPILNKAALKVSRHDLLVTKLLEYYETTSLVELLWIIRFEWETLFREHCESSEPYTMAMRMSKKLEIATESAEWTFKFRISGETNLGIFLNIGHLTNSTPVHFISIGYCYTLTNDSPEKSAIVSFPIDWKYSYGPSNVWDIQHVRRGDEVHIQAMEFPIHSLIMHYVGQRWSDIDFTGKDISSFPIRDIFSLAESEHLAISTEDKLLEFIAKYLKHHSHERLEGLIRALRLSFGSTEWLQSLQNDDDLRQANPGFVQFVGLELSYRTQDHYDEECQDFRDTPRWSYDPVYATRFQNWIVKNTLNDPTVRQETKHRLEAIFQRSQPVYRSSRFTTL